MWLAQPDDVADMNVYQGHLLLQVYGQGRKVFSE